MRRSRRNWKVLPSEYSVSFFESNVLITFFCSPIMQKLYGAAGAGGFPGGAPGGFPGAGAGAASEDGPSVEEVD